MRFLFLCSVALGFLACTPVSATAPEGFVPCADAADFRELKDSLCLHTETALHPTSSGSIDKVNLFVRKFPVANLADRKGEVWLVAGGPGESGAAFYSLLSVFRRAFPHHDLVVPDHRGTGYSTKLCPTQEAAEGPDGLTLSGAEWEPCIQSLHNDPSRAHAFNITNAGHDLSRLIAQHRGQGEIVVYAVSYGTQLALRMMQVAPQPLDGLILDGLVPAEGVAQWELSQRTAVVDRVGRATLSNRNLRAYRRLLARDDEPWGDVVPGGDLRRFMASLLNFPELRARLPMLVRTLSRGDTRLLARTRSDLEEAFGAMSKFPQSPPSLPLVMLISGSENNSRRELDSEIVANESVDALFTSALPGFLVDSPLPLYFRDSWFGKTPSWLPRTLVLHGTLDPNTPYEGALAHVRKLRAAGNITLITVENGAHVLPLVAPHCFEDTVRRFLARQKLQLKCKIPRGAS